MAKNIKIFQNFTQEKYNSSNKKKNYINIKNYKKRENYFDLQESLFIEIWQV